MKSPIIIIALAIIVTPLCRLSAQTDTIQRSYTLRYGSLPNIESGAATTIGATSLVFDQVNNLIDKKANNNFFLRLANFGLVQFYLGITGYAAAPHEYFGHYSRAKEFGITPHYRLDFPSLGGDNVFKVNYNMPVIERQMIVAAGPEFTNQLNYEATQQMYSGQKVPTYYGLYFLAGKLVDGILYVQKDLKTFLDDPNQYYADNAEYFQRNPVPNDPLSYALALTESYGYYDNIIDKNATWVYQPDDASVYVNDFIKDQYKRMKRAYVLQLFDPALVLGLYGNYNYLVNGKLFTDIPMLRVGDLRLMPSIRANLGELGAENYYDLYFLTPQLRAFNVYYRRGGNMQDDLQGGGINIRNVQLTKGLTAGIQADYWYNGRTNKSNYNVMPQVSARLTKGFAVLGAIGYKTEGGLMGKPYKEGLYGDVGLQFNLNYTVSK